MEKFTVEEINLICIYNTRDKNMLIHCINEGMPHVYEPDLILIMKNTINKLEHMTDTEFAEIGLTPC